MGGAPSRTNLRIQFAHRHVQDKILILEEGNHPYPQCPQCDMFVPQKDLKSRNLTTAFCRQGMERKWRRLAEGEAREGTERALTAYGLSLSQVTPFKYLGLVIAAEDNDWLAVVCNLRRARQKLVCMTQVLSREGAYARTSGQIYLAVLQSFLIYSSETWVLTLLMQRVLGIFHHRVDHMLTGLQPQKGQDGVWVYPPL